MDDDVCSKDEVFVFKLPKGKESNKDKIRNVNDLEKLAEKIGYDNAMAILKREGKGPSRIVQGGLHRDDFDYACRNEPEGYVLVAFVMDSDNYHWKAVYVKNEGQFP